MMGGILPGNKLAAVSVATSAKNFIEKRFLAMKLKEGESQGINRGRIRTISEEKKRNSVERRISNGRGKCESENRKFPNRFLTLSRCLSSRRAVQGGEGVWEGG